ERYGLNKVSELDFREIRATYYGMVSKIDFHVGKVLEKLKEIGKYENSVICFFSDHGDYTGDYGLVEKWPSGMQDCLTKVPLIIKIPGVKPVENIKKQLTQTIDIFPTLMEMAQIEHNYTHFGKSLIPLIKGQATTHRDAVFAEGGYNSREPQCFEDVVTSPEIPLIGVYYDKTNIQQERPETACRATMIRTEEWKLVLRSIPDRKEELYNLSEDPQELKNLIDDPQFKDKIKELKDRMVHWYIHTSDNPYWLHKRYL
ncbi:MAG: sulfatase/phosphatase domain-containing protein, partial [Candidatus Hodarchaeota archaeon]